MTDTKATGPSSGKLAVIVVGPPRTGTSAISHVLERLGVYFGERDRFLDTEVHRHNPVFFELRSVNALNDRICRAMGTEFGDFALLPREASYGDELYATFRDELLATVRDELASRPEIGLKDPRFVFTLPLWKRALEEAGYRCIAVVTDRDDDASLRSNKNVNGFTDEHNRRVVLLSKLLAAWQVRDLPALLLDFDDALAGPRSAAARLAAFVEAPDAAVDAAAAVLDPAIRNFPGADVPAPDAPPRGQPSAAVLAARAAQYEALLALLGSVGVDALLTRLVEERASLVASQGETAVVLAARDTELGRMRKQLSELLDAHLSLLSGLPSPDRLGLPASRLYAQTEDGHFSEDHAHHAVVTMADGRFEAVFMLDRAIVERVLRFDPDDVAGVFRLDSVSLAGQVDERPSERIVAVGEDSLTGDPAVIVAKGADPWWQVRLADLLPADPSAGAVELRMVFSRITLATAFLLPLLQRELRPVVEHVDAVAMQAVEVRSALRGVEGLVRQETAQASARAVEATHALRAEVIAKLHDHGAHADAQRVLGQDALMQAVQATQSATDAGQARMDALAAASEAHFAQLRAELDAMQRAAAADRELVARTLAWAERQSIGYWWRRIFR